MIDRIELSTANMGYGEFHKCHSVPKQLRQ